MQAAKAPSCKDREMLKDRLRADMKVYADAVGTLERSVGKSFEKAHQKAEHARLAFQAAREKLQKHMASHGCG